jgi:hypothetical protein
VADVGRHDVLEAASEVVASGGGLDEGLVEGDGFFGDHGVDDLGDIGGVGVMDGEAMAMWRAMARSLMASSEPVRSNRAAAASMI